jgi:serine/threonine protein kinase
LEQSVNICLALCATLRIANQENIVHRDLKQENIIVRNLDAYDIVMVDFGISFHQKAGANLTEHEETFQNSLIRLPERTGIGENKRNFRSDLTDVCAVLFFCLTGQPPRNLRNSNDNSPHKAFQAQIVPKANTPIQLNILNAFFEMGFQPDINLRFQSVDQLEARLKEILNPSRDEQVEPLSSIIASSRERLTKHDIKTRIEQFRNHILKSVESGYGQKETLGHAISLMCQNSEPYFINQSSQSEVWNEIQGYDRVYLIRIRVRNQTHNIEAIIEYNFVLENAECVVSRLIKGKKELAGKSYAEITPVDLLYPDSVVDLVPQQMVARYSDHLKFPMDELKNDVERAIGKCIKMVEERILKQ